MRNCRACGKAFGGDKTSARLICDDCRDLQESLNKAKLTPPPIHPDSKEFLKKRINEHILQLEREIEYRERSNYKHSTEYSVELMKAKSTALLALAQLWGK